MYIYIYIRDTYIHIYIYVYIIRRACLLWLPLYRSMLCLPLYHGHRVQTCLFATGRAGACVQTCMPALPN